jgi:hypothetical protein
MKALFLDFDGVLNSHQSATFWHYRRDQTKWENEMYADWKGTLKEYIAQEFCPIALSNMEALMRRIPDLKIVISSTWRMGETVESLKKILFPVKLVADAIIDVTPRLEYDTSRGLEIQAWLDKHLEVTQFVIVDDDDDMEHLKDRLVNTSALHGFQYADMLTAARMLDASEPADVYLF